MLERKFVGLPPARRLGMVRALVAIAALAQVIAEDFRPLDRFTLSLFQSIGILKHIPKGWWYSFLSAGTWVYALQMILIGFIILAMLGYFTRFALGVSAILMFVFLGLVKATSGNVDGGFLLPYLLSFLAFLPAGDGFAFERKLKNMPSDLRPNQVMGWSVFLIRFSVAMTFFQEGIVNLHRMGWSWFEPWNFKHMMLRNILNHGQSMSFIQLFHLPDFFWSTLALVFVAAELTAPLLIVSWHFRQIFPVALAAILSVMAVVTQTYVPGLILVLLVFYDWDRLIKGWMTAQTSKDKSSVLRREISKSSV